MKLPQQVPAVQRRSPFWPMRSNGQVMSVRAQNVHCDCQSAVCTNTTSCPMGKGCYCDEVSRTCKCNP